MYTGHALDYHIGHGGCHIWVRNYYDLKKTLFFV